MPVSCDPIKPKFCTHMPSYAAHMCAEFGRARSTPWGATANPIRVWRTSTLISLNLHSIHTHFRLSDGFQIFSLLDKVSKSVPLFISRISCISLLEAVQVHWVATRLSLSKRLVGSSSDPFLARRHCKTLPTCIHLNSNPKQITSSHTLREPKPQKNAQGQHLWP